MKDVFEDLHGSANVVADLEDGRLPVFGCVAEVSLARSFADLLQLVQGALLDPEPGLVGSLGRTLAVGSPTWRHCPQRPLRDSTARKNLGSWVNIQTGQNRLTN
ncbi:hypothetical protein RvY_06682-2 [Ramazzottius varieornatus]|uniref:Uncharacterized protein n=1 Tax=Ramazzottius varieornatus TaxID=947166 RepID=A0A1D1UZU7_RAMVA|nr:hypothetical protein RvY_06682-2 [Ramazzottius varieornatus]